MIENSLQTVVSILGIAAVLMYLIGGLIVFLYLAKYGVVEYQILQTKFLVIGVYYFVIIIASVLLSFIPAILLIYTSNSVYNFLFLLSISISIIFMILRFQIDETRNGFIALLILVLLGSISFIFPIIAIIKASLNNTSIFDSNILIFQASIIFLLSFISQAYYYANCIYGKKRLFFSRNEAFGIGTPIRIKIASDKETITLLSNIGIPVNQEYITEEIVLLDESDRHYIIGIPTKNSYKAVKVSKEAVKSVIYIDWL